ncbi:low affinity iron permease family protein [Patescibacteria group bacterium]|nr:low affinity iron permease family protein [Patescibacteria group bacterium]
MNEIFRKISAKVAAIAGRASTFLIAVSTIILWLVSGPIFNYSDTWQLAINTATTIITFLMVFLIQNTQNRDSKAMHLKLDELIKVTKTASNTLIEIEEGTDEEMDNLEDKFKKIKKDLES